MKPKFNPGDRVVFNRRSEADRLYREVLGTVSSYGWDERHGEFFYLVTVDGEREGGERLFEIDLKKYRKPAVSVRGSLRPVSKALSPIDEKARAIVHHVLTTRPSILGGGHVIDQMFGLPRGTGYDILLESSAYIQKHDGITPKDSAGYVRKVKNLLVKLG